MIIPKPSQNTKKISKIVSKKMLVSLFVFLVMFIVFSYVNYETKPLLSENNKCLCDSVQDPHENPLMYNYGRFKGQCVNSCTRRSSYIIEQKNFKDQITIANLLHENEFWTASIPLNSIEKTQIVFENFSSDVNHVSLKFIFKNRIQIQSQDLNKPLRNKILKENSLVFSPEAAPPNDYTYSLFDGFMGRYGIIFRAYSSEFYKSMTLNLKHKTRYKNLKLNSDEVKKLFVFSFLKFYETPIPNYQLLFNNCATISVDLILDSKNLLRSKGWDIWDVLDPLRGLPASSPIGTIRSLLWWKLVEDDFYVLEDISS